MQGERRRGGGRKEGKEELSSKLITFTFSSSFSCFPSSAHLLATAGLNLADLTYRVERATAPAALGGTFEPLIPLSDGDVDVSSFPSLLSCLRLSHPSRSLSEAHAQLLDFYRVTFVILESNSSSQLSRNPTPSSQTPSTKLSTTVFDPPGTLKSERSSRK